MYLSIETIMSSGNTCILTMRLMTGLNKVKQLNVIASKSKNQSHLII